MKDNATEQYITILKAFEEVIEKVGRDDDDIWHVIDVLAEVRAKHLVSIVADGLLITYDYAINIVRENIDKRRSEITDTRAVVLISAIHNLIDFSVCQQYQMIRDMPAEIPTDLSSEEMEEIYAIFYRYNEIFSGVENNTVNQAAIVALAWMQISNESELIQFTTQRDERVRHSHAIMDGLKFPKSDFPSELIPPVDYNCRCFLVRTGEIQNRILASASKGERWEDIVNPIFSESLAKGGKIFGESHPYFSVQKSDIDRINGVINSVTGRLVWYEN